MNKAQGGKRYFLFRKRHPGDGLTLFSCKWPTPPAAKPKRVGIRDAVVYLTSMIQRMSMVAGWLALAFIVYATLSPLQERPVVAGPQLEHFAAFALMGLAFGIAYPSRIVLVFVLVIGSSFALEALQLLTPDRHGRVVDAVVKAAGGVCGIGANLIWSRLLQERILRLVQRAPS